MRSMRKKYVTLLMSATIIAGISGGSVWASSDDIVNSQTNNTQEIQEEVSEDTIVSKPIIKTKLNAADMYSKVEKNELSELAKMTSTPDWLLQNLIKSGEFGETVEDIKANLEKEDLDYKNIDIAKLLEEKKSALEKPDTQELMAETDVEYDNLVTKHYNVSNLDDHKNEAYTKGGEPKEENAEVVAEPITTEVEETPKEITSDKSTVIKAFPHKSFKSYMRWTALHPQSKQGIFAAKATADPETGIMMYNGRYLIALGSAYASYVGEEIDVIMESGQIIPAVIGDFKADEHVDENHSTHLMDGSVIEFVVSSNEAAGNATNNSGSYNNIFPGLVKEFRK